MHFTGSLLHGAPAICSTISGVVHHEKLENSVLIFCASRCLIISEVKMTGSKKSKVLKK
jgi:hypothetical protein